VRSAGSFEVTFFTAVYRFAAPTGSLKQRAGNTFPHHCHSKHNKNLNFIISKPAELVNKKLVCSGKQSVQFFFIKTVDSFPVHHNGSPFF